MRVLLDECVPLLLGVELVGHAVSTVPREGWSSFQNGKLLALAQERFDVFVTTDKSIPAQQAVARFNIAVVVLRAASNRLEDLTPFVPELLALLPTATKGKVVIIPQSPTGGTD